MTPVGLAMGIQAVALRVIAASEDVDTEHVESFVGRRARVNGRREWAGGMVDILM